MSSVPKKADKLNIYLSLGLRPANERRRYFVTTSPISWAQAYNQPCHHDHNNDDYDDDDVVCL